MAPKPGNFWTKRMHAFQVARVRTNQSLQPTSSPSLHSPAAVAELHRWADKAVSTDHVSGG